MIKMKMHTFLGGHRMVTSCGASVVVVVVVVVVV